MRKRWPAASSSARSCRVVVDLAVLDDDDRAVLVGDRLVAAVEVDDREPPRGQPDRAVARRSPAPSGPRWRERVAHRARARRGRRPPAARGRCRRCRTSPRRDVAGRARPRRSRSSSSRPMISRYSRTRAVGDVLEVVGELLGPGHLARQPQLREAGDARADDEPLPVRGDVLRELLEEAAAGSGAGRRCSSRRAATFQSCGSSSSLVARRMRPTRVCSLSRHARRAPSPGVTADARLGLAA